MNRQTLSDMATKFAVADEISPFDNFRLGQLRHLDKRGCLVGGRTIDGRGTKAFDATELYRARILCALLDMGLDGVSVSGIVSAAETAPASQTEGWPDRTRTEAGRVWRGFEDVVRGVTEHGEGWTLELRLVPQPGRPAKLAGRYRWLEAREYEDTAAHGVIVLHLRSLFAGLPRLEG